MLRTYTLANGATVFFYDSNFDRTVYFGGRGYKHSKAYGFWFDGETRREVTDEILLRALKWECTDDNPNCYKNLTPNIECSEEEKTRIGRTKYFIKSTKDLMVQFIDVPAMEKLIEIKAMLEVLDNLGVKYDYSFRGSTMIISAMQSWNWRELMEILKNMKFTNMEKMCGYSDRFDNDCWKYRIRTHTIPDIKKIIVNDKTTIIIWNDNTKTIVRPSANDNYDLEAAVCAAIAKKIYGTNSAFKRMIKEKVVVQENKKKEKKDNDPNVSPTNPRHVENDDFVSTKEEEDSLVYTGSKSLYNIDPNPTTEGEKE